MDSVEKDAAVLFKEVKYFLCDERNEEVKQLFKEGGASREFFVTNLVTHIVSSTTNFPEYNQAKDMDIPIVKPDWVLTCVQSNALLPVAPFTTEKNKLFSNIVACPSQIPNDDRDALWAMVTFYGGKWQSVFNDNCTHLLVLKPDGDKYECAIKNPDKVKVVVPDWIVDSIKAKKLLDEAQYAPAPLSGSQTAVVDKTPPEGSILTPDNDGETTAATLGTTGQQQSVAPALPSPGLLTPETPNLRKDDNKSELDIAVKDIEVKRDNPSPVDSVDLFDDAADSGKESSEGESINNKNSGSDTTTKRESRQAAESAKERLKKSNENNDINDDENDDDYINDDDEDDEEEGGSKAKNGHVSAGGEAEEGKEGLQDEKDGCSSEDSSKVVEVADGENRELNTEIFKKSLEKQTIVVSNLFSGCVLFFSDYPELVSAEVLDTWITVIKQHGGTIVPTYSPDVTHFVSPHQHGAHYAKALSDKKYMVTAYWLNDVICVHRLFQPKLSLHLPVPFKDKVLRCRNMIISLTGFEGDERTAVKNMIKIIGAKYNNIFTKANTHLICRSATGQKYEKAKEWKVQCANARWLGDVVTGGCDYPVNMKRYQTFGDDHALDINNILARDLLDCWKDFEEVSEPTDKKRKLETLENEMKELEHKKAKVEEPLAPATVQPPALFKTTANWPNVAMVVFTGLNPTLVTSLTEKLTSLGGVPCASVKSCTHIVASKIMRTIKFLTGISVCQYIVNPDWIEESYRVGHYVDEKDYILRDASSEKLYGMNLPESIMKAQRRPLFKSMTIYVTPNVRPEQKSMAEIVGCAGGKLLVQMPIASSFKLLAEQKTEEGHPAFVCVTCDDDLHLCKEMKVHGIGIYNVEFVLSGILKQQLEFYRYKL